MGRRQWELLQELRARDERRRRKERRRAGALAVLIFIGMATLGCTFVAAIHSCSP